MKAAQQSLSEHADFSAGRAFQVVTELTAIFTPVATVTNLPGVLAVTTPIAGDLAKIAGLPLTTVLMTQVLAFSNVFPPYQAPLLVTAIQAGHLPTGAIARLCWHYSQSARLY